MPINQTGQVLLDALGNFEIIGGDTAGAVAITAGAQFVFDNPTFEGDNLRTLGALGRGDGTLLVRDTGSSFSMEATPGSTVGLGVGFQGDGTIQIESGGALSLSAPLDVPDSIASILLAIEPGSKGFVEISEGTLTMEGRSTALSVGLEGRGIFRVTDNSDVTISAVEANLVTIGDNNTFPSVIFVENGSSMTLTDIDAPDVDGSVESLVAIAIAGERENGRLSIQGDLSLLAERGSVGITAGYAERGDGEVSIDGGTLTMRSVSVSGNTDAPLTAEMIIATENGDGTLTMDGGQLIMEGTDLASLVLSDNGDDSIANITNSDIDLKSDGLSEIVLGRGTELRGDSEMNLQQGSSIVLEGASAELIVGGPGGLRSELHVDQSTIDILATAPDGIGRFIIGTEDIFSTTTTITGDQTRISGDELRIGAEQRADGSTPRANVYAGEGATIAFDNIILGEGTDADLGNMTFEATSIGEMAEFVMRGDARAIVDFGTRVQINANVTLEDGVILGFERPNVTSLGRIDFKGNTFKSDEIILSFTSFGGVLNAGESQIIATFDFAEYDFGKSGDASVSGFANLSPPLMLSRTHTYDPDELDGTPREQIEWRITTLDSTALTTPIFAAPGASATISTTVNFDAETQTGSLTIGQVGVNGYSTHETARTNRFSGSQGDDIMSTTGVGQGAYFKGLAGNDQLDGGENADLLDGGEGTDQMTGGAGNDIYFVDSALDQVIELAGEGDDIIYSSTSLTIPVNVEVLIASGTTDIDLTGSDARDILQGNDGDNIINGAGGFDVMAGGTGNDVYAVDNSLDAVVEEIGGGYDNVYSSIDFIISETSEVESVLLTGNAVVVRGSSTNNQVFGNGVTNVIDGRDGIDYLLGFGGADIFQITAGDTGEDVIGDFSRTDGDRIALAGFDGANTTVTQGADGIFTIADATAGTSQTFKMRDGYGIDAYTSGDLVEGQDYYFA